MGWSELADGAVKRAQLVQTPGHLHASQGRPLTGHRVPGTTSQKNPKDIVEHAAQALYSQSGKTLRNRFTKPVAIVLAKADLPIIQRELGVRPLQEVPRGNWRQAGTPDSQKIADWLRQNEPELYQLIEVRFANIRFFAASAYGSEDAEGRRFTPKGALAPVCWIFSHHVLLHAPFLARAGRTTLEWTTMATVQGLILGVFYLVFRLLF